MHSLASFAALLAAPLAVSASQRASTAACTLTASGGDDGPTFVQAAQECSTVTIPTATTLSISSRMNMTGLANTDIELLGTVEFSNNMTYWINNGFYFDFQTQIAFWLLGGTNVRLYGGGTINGNGQAWYDAFASNDTLLRPILLTVYQATDLSVENINMLNGPEWINFVNEGENILYNGINISAVSTSSNPAKNTDGWDIYRSNNVTIINSTINNGDDCVSLKPNATNIVASYLSCNGSHGISVGSLGQYEGEYDIVENFTSTNVYIANAENGARIKAFAGPGVGSGIVKNVTYSFFTESNVDSPVVIDQCYFTSEANCTAYPSNVYIQDITFTNMSGTSSGNEKNVVASLACSPDGRCENITVNNFNLAPPTSYGNANFTCQNVNLTGNAASLFGDCATT
ncbi:hypothetical protein CONPUDRAFT_154318 [Coniophora puteana RWD-64-598 SS2]|uniref:galacturonan 1,4-alpha-galacturonidase n=1 Tax=Coniophora puteana (strain RWD-64-598) TaxID=741705 RepID=A0A5M3MQB1_CONPW|nr:uncharacterized protein CONPUDRAFT_154318 [Coniophora puteana RWD-64-598 SS2]EIW80875.1 hypothetical protein CONPUDRAFT_154318 [Coniophora puteana RWD-64-598 SS2]